MGMIESHFWTGWWEPSESDATLSLYGPCETLVNGEPCGRERHEHKSIDNAYRRPTPVAASRPTREGRAGDSQPMPVATNGPVMHRLVQDDLEARLRVGIERYGQPLQPFNGRDALQDVYEEILDAAVYIRQCIYERDNPRHRPYYGPLRDAIDLD